jgi:hypothetical protein
LIVPEFGKSTRRLSPNFISPEKLTSQKLICAALCTISEFRNSLVPARNADPNLLKSKSNSKSG